MGTGFGSGAGVTSDTDTVRTCETVRGKVREGDRGNVADAVRWRECERRCIVRLGAWLSVAVLIGRINDVDLVVDTVAVRRRRAAERVGVFDDVLVWFPLSGSTGTGLAEEVISWLRVAVRA